MNPLLYKLLGGLFLAAGILTWGYHWGSTASENACKANLLAAQTKSMALLQFKQEEVDKANSINQDMAQKLETQSLEKKNEIAKLQATNDSLAKQLGWLWSNTPNTASDTNPLSKDGPSTSPSSDPTPVQQFAAEGTRLLLEISEADAELENYANVCHLYAQAQQSHLESEEGIGSTSVGNP